jgi:hypothetical protein
MPSAWRIQARIRSTRVRFNYSLLSSGVALRGGLPRKPAARACRHADACRQNWVLQVLGVLSVPVPGLGTPSICDYMGTPCRGAREAPDSSLTGHHRWVLAALLLAALLLAAPLVTLAGHAGQFHAAGAPRACECAWRGHRVDLR